MEVKELAINSRYLVSTYKDENVSLTVFNVYGPCSNFNEKNEFLKSIQQTYKNLEEKSLTQNIIMMGDFNMVQNNELDIISGLPHNVDVVRNFNSFVHEMLLTDTWREKNQLKKQFTWNSNKPFVARRLDYIFVSQDILPFCKTPQIKTIGFSDHRAVSITLDFASFKRGQGSYKFNTNLLHNVHFVKEVKDELKRINDLDLNAHWKWEYVKVQFKNLGLAYGRSVAKNRNDRKKYLYSLLDELEKNMIINPDDLETTEKYNKVKQELEVIIIKETEGARLRSGQKWAEEGEKCTKYFLNLEKQRSCSNTIFKLLKKSNKTSVTRSDEILKEIECHFKNIYSCNKNTQEDNTSDYLFLNPLK